jgi:superfamily II DNA/RNA helicase
MLHRVKEDVERSIGAKEETIVEVELSRTQKLLYRLLIDREVPALMQGVIPAQNNLVMQLRKVCNHPSLIGSHDFQIDPREANADLYLQMINCCGKLVFVDKLLAKLAPTGEKVLIFSQMTKVLDVLEDFCRYRRYTYERIDGQVTGNRRQLAVDHFNSPDGGVFIFLLCTRAGGQGLNLTAATKVIIYDSDWNPQNDIQAQARCHRIGQKNKVDVYRLITRKTYESEMFLRASKKLGLDQAILNSKIAGRDQEMSVSEVDRLLRLGAYNMCDQNDDEIETFRSEDIDEMLAKRAHPSSSASIGGSAFSKASFGTGNEGGAVDDPDFWKKYSPAAAESAPQARDFVYGQRDRRKTKRYDDGDADAGASFWNKNSVNRVRVSLSRFGWNRWSKIMVESGFQGNEKDIEDGCAVIVWLAAGKEGRQVKEFCALTGVEQLTSSQRSLMSNVYFADAQFRASVQNKASHLMDRLKKLKVFESWMRRSDEPPVVALPKNEPKWTRKLDAELVKVVYDHGWAQWEAVLSNPIFRIKSEDKDNAKLVKKRFEQLFEKMGETSEIPTEPAPPSKKPAREHHDDHHRKRESSSSSSSKKRSHSKKEVARVEPEPPKDPEAQRLSIVATLLRYCGEPDSDELWDMFYQVTSIPEVRDYVQRILIGARTVLSEPDRDPKRLFKETPELIGIVNFKVADRVINACNWASRFRAFYPEKFDPSRLDLLRPLPEWWDHIALDIPLFRHVSSFGFSRPSTLLSEPPFSDLVPAKNREAVSRAAAKERETGKRVKSNVPSNLSFLLSKKELRNHIDAIIHDLAIDDTPELRISLDRKALRGVLPRIFNEALIEAIGTGEFGVVNGYLYRIGF